MLQHAPTNSPKAGTGELIWLCASKAAIPTPIFPMPHSCSIFGHHVIWRGLPDLPVTKLLSPSLGGFSGQSVFFHPPSKHPLLLQSEISRSFRGHLSTRVCDSIRICARLRFCEKSATPMLKMWLAVRTAGWVFAVGARRPCLCTYAAPLQPGLAQLWRPVRVLGPLKTMSS